MSPSPPAGDRFRRGVIILPSAFTLGNLFLGFWSIVAASRGELFTAAWLIVLAGVADMIDGRVARFTRTGTDFGQELDSLVDAVSFGVAPAMLMYFLYFEDGTGLAWTVCFLFSAAVVLRLARFNIEQAGHAKAAFHGLPSPAAGMTLATFYPFSQTGFFAEYLAGLPWPTMVTGMMVVLSMLMLSHVLYPVVPRFDPRTFRGISALATALAAVVFAIVAPSHFFFPALATYIAYGLGRSAVLGFLDRLPERDPLIDEEEDEENRAHHRAFEYAEFNRARPAGGSEGSEAPPGSSPPTRNRERP